MKKALVRASRANSSSSFENPSRFRCRQRAAVCTTQTTAKNGVPATADIEIDFAGFKTYLARHAAALEGGGGGGGKKKKK